jgi:hypothetical protein
MNAGRTRRRIRWSTLPVLLLAVVLMLTYGISYIDYFGTANRGVETFAAGRYTEAILVFRDQHSPIEPVGWQADYNEGTAWLADLLDSRPDNQDLPATSPDQATRLLDAAFEAAAAAGVASEQMCAVTTNDAIANELSGAYRMNRGDQTRERAANVRAAIAARDAGLLYDATLLEPDNPGGPEPDPDIIDADADLQFRLATQNYEHAANLRGNGACGASGNNQQEQENQYQRGADQDQASQARAKSNSQDPSEPEPQEDPQDEEQRRQQQLQESNEKGTRSADQEQEWFDSTSGTSDGQLEDQPGDQPGGGDIPRW